MPNKYEIPDKTKHVKQSKKELIYLVNIQSNISETKMLNKKTIF